MLWFRIKTFFQFLLKSTNEHGVHSPFVYAFVTRCLYSRTSQDALKLLRSLRKPALQSQQSLQMLDRGEGSQHFKTSRRPVSKIAKNAGMGWHQSKLMQKIVDYFNINLSLELGTSVGLGSLALAANQPNNKVETVDACPNTSNFAKHYFENHNLKHIQVHTTEFQSFLSQLPKDKTYDLVYLDGHHQKNATLQYFSTLKNHIHDNSLIILDDIYWSKGMQEAWQTICRDDKVKVSIDLYFWGIVFFKPELSKQDFKIRCLF
ncbi:O-methyltransferase [Mesohalobacter halotolerans]|uniref:Class I SAM-dependent methyltransferase n=1 Tax=Mesohalobacter halotolerans TaxID=1883405 RepID=A0A4U5TUX0_9FLAO|nr:class I SAM-dependent methyltransferase [Mesohalobacter halotolerans]MBS3738105.1 class I SAM-dependent methyltransferase [Psychroflexus sp.]TKS57098.1 class I SAM-dependent methyltransferase [Mesohalobacter halotolerans]